MFAPSQSTIDAVHSWLVASGVEPARVVLSPGRHWLKFNATITEVESLLQTEYKYYQHPSGQGHIACDEYSIPKTLQEHVDLIIPTVHFDTKIVSEPEFKRKKRNTPANLQPGNPSNTGFMPKKGKTLSGPTPDVSAAYTLANCNQFVTPDCLRALYKLPNGTLAKSSYAVVEYTPQAYLQSDLNKFYSTASRQIPQGTGPVLDSIDGGVDQTTSQSFNNNGESDLDLEYAIALGMVKSSASQNAV